MPAPPPASLDRRRPGRFGEKFEEIDFVADRGFKRDAGQLGITRVCSAHLDRWGPSLGPIALAAGMVDTSPPIVALIASSSIIAPSQAS
jgi:hypothetical protein